MPTRTAPANCPACGDPLRVGYAAAKAARTPPAAWAVFVAGVVTSLTVGLAMFPAVMFAWQPVLAPWNLNWKDRGTVYTVTYVALVPLVAWPGRRGWQYLTARLMTTSATCERCGWVGSVRVLEDDARTKGTELADAKRRMRQKPPPAESPNPEFDFTAGPTSPRPERREESLPQHEP